MCTNVEPDPVEADRQSGSRPRRKKLWDLCSAYHCSVVGTCLSPHELRQLCRKLRITAPTTLTDYELHRAFVAIAESRSYAARRLHAHLDHKYRTAIRQLAEVRSDAALSASWQHALESGDLPGAYWALMTHPLASETLRHRIYGEVHMRSHLASAAGQQDSEALARLRRLIQTLNQRLIDAEARATARLADKDAAIDQLHERLMCTREAEKQLADARRSLAALEREPRALQLQRQLEKCESRLADIQARAERAEADAREWQCLAIHTAENESRLQQQLARAQAERDTVDQTLHKLLPQDCTTCSDDDACQRDVDLSGRCVLYVGGRGRQCAHFREVVERQNGRFLHHDGGLHEGTIRLGSILPKADVVVCPLDCISHDAASRIKQFCKRYGKRLVLLPKSSLAAFTRGLNELPA